MGFKTKLYFSRNDKTSNLTILVCSCDAFSDIWDVYFEMLYKKWPDCPFKIVLNTETKSYKNKHFDVEVINLDRNLSKEEIANVSWSERLMLCLKKIKTKYILFTLEDVYFLNKINSEQIKTTLSKLDRIRNFSMLYFYNLGPKYYKEKLDLYRVHRFAEFNYNITCNLWNKKQFLKVLTPGESPWQSEQGIKNRAEKKGGKYYCTKENDLISFSVAKYGLIQGKWAPLTQELFKSNDIDFDFSVRGFFKSPDSDKNPENNNYDYFQIIKDRWEKLGAEKSYFKYTLHCWPKWTPKWIIALGRKLKK